MWSGELLALLYAMQFQAIGGLYDMVRVEDLGTPKRASLLHELGPLIVPGLVVNNEPKQDERKPEALN